MAFFVGVVVWSISSMLLLVVRIPVRPYIVIPLCVCIIGVAYYLNRAAKHEFKKNTLRYIVLSFVYVTVFMLANILVLNTNRIILTPDSFGYSGMGLIIAESGTFPAPGLDAESASGFIHQGNILLPLLWAGSKFFGVDFYFSVFPLAALCFLPAFALLFVVSSNGLGLGMKTRVMLGCVGAMLLGSVPSYWHHAYYLSSGTLTAVFFTMCVSGVWIYRRQGDVRWLVLASLCQICTVLLRTEMLNFSVIPIVMLMGGACRIKRRDYIAFLAPYLLVCVIWQGYKTYQGGMGGFGEHENSLIQLGTLFIFALTYVVIHFRFTRRVLVPLAPCLLVCVLLSYLIFALYFNHTGTVRSIAGLLQALSYPMGWCEGGAWGWIWLTMAVFAVVNCAFIRSKSFVFWGQAVLIYLSMRIILYSLDFMFPDAAINQFNSGNRMLIHILPLGIMGMLHILASALVRGMRHGDSHSETVKMDG
ncbi:MAG: hypothetical protein KAH23_02045 [Kiritimatiellae bacterium]|nr:hypothetical protein [Kiritimatiellia bacterium]